jgi:Tol biopolymer transport system component
MWMEPSGFRHSLPDGTRVAYSRVAGDEFDFSWYLEMKMLGSETRLRLTNSPAAFPPGPAWSPNGREIAFARASALDDRGIFIVSAIGGPERKLRSLASVALLSARC